VTLADQLGACEKILYTPMPWIYTLHLRFVLLLFLFMTPLGMFERHLDYEDPSPLQVIMFMSILAYCFLGLEDMAVQIQNPFGLDPSNLPLDMFTIGVAKDVSGITEMKYFSFGQDYTEKLNELGEYEIARRKKQGQMEDEDDDADADD